MLVPDGWTVAVFPPKHWREVNPRPLILGDEVAVDRNEGLDIPIGENALALPAMYKTQA